MVLSMSRDGLPCWAGAQLGLILHSAVYPMDFEDDEVSCQIEIGDDVVRAVK